MHHFNHQFFSNFILKIVKIEKPLENKKTCKKPTN